MFFPHRWRSGPNPGKSKRVRVQPHCRNHRSDGWGGRRLPETAGSASGTFANFPVAQAQSRWEEAEGAAGGLAAAGQLWVGLRRLAAGLGGGAGYLKTRNPKNRKRWHPKDWRALCRFRHWEARAAKRPPWRLGPSTAASFLLLKVV